MLFNNLMTNKLILTMRCFAFLAVVSLSLFLSACGGPSYPKAAPIPTDIRPEAPVAVQLPAYRIQIGDVLELKFYLNPEFDEVVTVRPDGMISTKVADDIFVYNKTPKQVTSKVRGLYRKDLKDPHVTTIVRSFAPIRIYVSGEVNNPGEFVVVGHALTVTQAIARAGGVKNSAQPDKVLIIRRGASEKSEVLLADYDAATQGGDPTKDARLAPYDVIYVPKSGAALAYKEYQQHLQQFIAPSFGMSYGIKN